MHLWNDPFGHMEGTLLTANISKDCLAGKANAALLGVKLRMDCEAFGKLA